MAVVKERATSEERSAGGVVSPAGCFSDEGSGGRADVVLEEVGVGVGVSREVKPLKTGDVVRRLGFGELGADDEELRAEDRFPGLAAGMAVRDFVRAEADFFEERAKSYSFADGLCLA